MSALRCPKCGLTQMAAEACKRCGQPLAAPAAAQRPAAAPVAAGRRAAPAAAAAADPAFALDRYQVRQQLLTIGEKYEILDDRGQLVAFGERPAHLLRNLLAVSAAVAAALAWAAAGFWLATLVKDPPVVVVVLAMTAIGGGALVAGVLAFTALQKKRDLGLYRDASKAELLLVVRQGPSALLRYTFAVCEPSGATLAHVSKNILTDLFRKRWECRAADGRLLCVAQEDSLLRALLRRLVSQLVLLHFVIYRGDGDVRLGEFRREMTLRDRYVLDLAGDRGRTLDRRLALAIGLLLDTGERR